MGKNLKLYFTCIGLLLAGFVLYMGTATMPINWKEHYSPTSPEPFGTLIFKEKLQGVFQNLELYSAHDLSYFTTDSTGFQAKNYIFINQNPSPEVSKKILASVAQGSNVLLATKNPVPFLLDTLGVQTQYKGTIQSLWLCAKESRFELNNYPKLQNKVDIYTPEPLFTEKANKNIKILGYRSANPYDNEQKKSVHFIEIPHGKGKIYYHSTPFVYTNYALKDIPAAKEYAEATLAYLPTENHTVWFMHSIIKNKIWEKNGIKNTSFLAFVVQHDSLKTAWQLLIMALVLYLIFMGKRTQRAVPIIEPKQNTSVEFIQSISNLYFQAGNFNELFEAKTQYFLNQIRQQYLLSTPTLDANFALQLQAKTGKNYELINKIIQLIIKHKQGEQLTETDFKNLSLYIDEFWQKPL